MNQPEGSGTASSGGLRTVALAALVCGALASVALVIAAGLETPPFLLVIFVGWVLSPFVALALANAWARRWPSGSQSALHWLMLVVSVGTPVIYGMRVAGFHGWKGAFFFTLVPPVTGALALILAAVATIQARRSPV